MGRGINPQRAARRRLQGAGDVVGLLDIGQNLDRAVVIGPAHLGQTDLPRGAVEQPRARRSSSAWTWLLTIVVDMLSRRPAAENPPLSATRTKAVRAGQPIHRQRLRLSALTG